MDLEKVKKVGQEENDVFSEKRDQLERKYQVLFIITNRKLSKKTSKEKGNIKKK